MENQSQEPHSPLSNDPLIRKHLQSHGTLEAGIIIAVGISIFSIILSTVAIWLARG